MLNEIPIILIASKEQQEAEQDYYKNALGLGNAYIFAENHEEARLFVAGNTDDKTILSVLESGK